MINRLLLLQLLLFLQPLTAAVPDPSLQLTAEQQQWLAAHPVIRVSNELDWSPFDFAVDGRPMGYSIDLMDHLADMLGVRFEYVNGYNWGELLQLFRDKQIDVMSAIYKTRSRAQFALFTQSYFSNPPAIITRQDEAAIDSIQDLQGRRVALPADFALFETLPKEIPGVIMVSEIDGKPILSTLDALKAVVSGKADAVVESAATLTHQIEENALPNLKIADYPNFRHIDVSDYDLYAAVRNDWPVLRDILVKALGHVDHDFRLNLQKKWFGMSTLVGNNRLHLSFQEKAYLTRKGVIRYCVDPYWMPYEGLDNDRQHIGMTAEIIRRLEERLGIPFRVYPTYSWQESLARMQSGDCELLPAAMPTAEREQYLAFTDAVFDLPLVIATRTERPFVEDIAQLANEKVAIARGYAHVDLFRQRYPGLLIVEVDNLENGLALLEQGEVFAVADTVATLRYAIATNHYDDIRIGGTTDIMLRLSFASRRDSGQMLVTIIDKAMQLLPENELEELRYRWSQVEVEKVLDTAVVWKIGTAGLLVIFLVLLWNRKLARISKQLNQANSELERLSRQDDLTGLLNRRAFVVELHEELARCQRTGESLSLLLMDADHFKAINDIHGHAAGDEVLVAMAATCRQVSREIDILGRIGGEEFVMVLPATGQAGALRFAERVREVIARAQVSYAEKQLQLTVSIGVATLEPGESLEQLMHRADQAMYRAKQKGRNRVEVA